MKERPILKSKIIMRIGHVIIMRSAEIRKSLVDFREVRFKNYAWHRTLGIYQSRIFGLCIFHDGTDILRVYENIINDKHKEEKK